MWLCASSLRQVFELCNLISHLQLRYLRPAGTTVRKIPRGFLFELVSCPNYTCEILAWISFSFMTQSVAGTDPSAGGAAALISLPLP